MSDMSAFDATLVATVVAFILFLVGEQDAGRRKAALLILIGVIVTLIILAYFAGWATILIPGRAPVSVPESVTPSPAASGDITMDQAVSRIKRGIDDFITNLLVYGIMIGVVVSMIKSFFRR